MPPAAAPLVSTILPSHNHVRFIDDAVESVLNQGIDALELIVVDDASSDGTPDRVARQDDARIRLIRLDDNRRRHARNDGIAVATGKYIAFQNSDDVWIQGKLRKQLDVLERDPSIVACFTATQIIDEDGVELRESWARQATDAGQQSSAAWLRRFFEAGNSLCISSAVVRHDALRTVGRFKPSLTQLGDLDCWVRLAAIGGFHVLDEALVQMRVTGRNLSAPGAATSRRAAFEFIDVLGRYAERPLLGRLPQVFADIWPSRALSDECQLGRLALLAWTRSPAHVLFGTQLMSRLLDDDGHREALVEVFGVDIIHTFIAKRGELGLLSHAPAGHGPSAAAYLGRVLRDGLGGLRRGRLC